MERRDLHRLDARAYGTAMRKLLLVAFALLPVTAGAAETYRNVGVAELAAHPDKWDGQRVRVQGLAVRQFEDHGLYASYEDYCRHNAGDGAAIWVKWPRGPHADDRAGRFRRMAVIEGVFHKAWPLTPDDAARGTIVVSNAAPGPGPLTDVRVVRWTSGPISRCGVPDPEEGGGRVAS